VPSGSEVDVFAPGSRYEEIEIATVTVVAAGGAEREIRYVRRRFLPRVDAHTALVEHRVAPGERLDLLAARYAGDPTEFWRLCDANGVLRPEELEATGRVVTVAMPGT
jgi:hypothetical protein